ncbi:MAG: RNA polymerase subunit sigma [Flavobacteriales bacterium]|nr:RNA polymerase subunit sigma [Flavobacteriales bacterium]|tara:strand:+ start:150 stop:692 length:543 start_codon:yes stop_codon:yes gene_type:complete
MDKDNYYLEQLKEGNQKVLDEIYLRYKNEFINFGKKYSQDEETLLDVFQDCMIVLYENVRSSKLTTLNSSLKTYLFSVGKYKLYRFNQESQKKNVEWSIEHQEETTHQLFEEEINVERMKLINKAFEQLGKKCRQLLKLFYYRGFDLEEIKNEMNLENKNTVKSQKSRCLSHLRKLTINS